MQKVDVLVIGAGPAGTAAAIAAKEAGAKEVLIVERGDRIGGILNQCIHNGFGLQLFGEELTGPEYAQRYADKTENAGIEVLLQTIVLKIEKDRSVLLQNTTGIFQVSCGSVIVATGCRERPRGAINIPGSRPSGIFSAGTAQKLVNIKGYMPGKNVVILGSGDIGLIMARRMTLEGARVLAVCEIMPYSSGLKRNIVQCLESFDIPLHLSTTVTKILGKERVERVEISAVDSSFKPIDGTQRIIECDTLLLSVGLIPENELLDGLDIEMDTTTGGAIVNDKMETSAQGIFACGNCLHVHDLADYASLEAEIAGKNAALFTLEKRNHTTEIPFLAGFGITGIVPQKVSLDALKNGVVISLRVKQPFENSRVIIKNENKVIKEVREQHFLPGEMIRFTLKADNAEILIAEVIKND